MYEVLILLVLVNLGFTSHIWRTVRRGPKRKFLGKLLNGNPRTLWSQFGPFMSQRIGPLTLLVGGYDEAIAYYSDLPRCECPRPWRCP
jgi:hypothetical protein